MSPQLKSDNNTDPFVFISSFPVVNNVTEVEDNNQELEEENINTETESKQEIEEELELKLEQYPSKQIMVNNDQKIERNILSLLLSNSKKDDSALNQYDKRMIELCLTINAINGLDVSKYLEKHLILALQRYEDDTKRDDEIIELNHKLKVLKLRTELVKHEMELQRRTDNVPNYIKHKNEQEKKIMTARKVKMDDRINTEKMCHDIHLGEMQHYYDISRMEQLNHLTSLKEDRQNVDKIYHENETMKEQIREIKEVANNVKKMIISSDQYSYDSNNLPVLKSNN